jgi:hypothetical protein
MMAVLPGIDANDEAKTAAVFQFYTAVLASVPALRGADTEEADLARACSAAAELDRAVQHATAGQSASARGGT